VERTLTAHTLPAPRTSVARRLVPLWRHGAAAACLFVVLVVSAFIRLDVQQLRKDLDRTSRATLEAQVLNDRLTLEMESRRRAIALERAATQLALGPAAALVSVEAQP
jgi:hypothetical protein